MEILLAQSSLHLLRWAGDISIRAEDTAVPCFGSQNLVTTDAAIEKLTAINKHCDFLHKAALWTCQLRCRRHRFTLF